MESSLRQRSRRPGTAAGAPTDPLYPASHRIGPSGSDRGAGDSPPFTTPVGEPPPERRPRWPSGLGQPDRCRPDPGSSCGGSPPSGSPPLPCLAGTERMRGDGCTAATRARRSLDGRRPPHASAEVRQGHQWQGRPVRRRPSIRTWGQSGIIRRAGWRGERRPGWGVNRLHGHADGRLAGFAGPGHRVRSPRDAAPIVNDGRPQIAIPALTSALDRRGRPMTSPGSPSEPRLRDSGAAKRMALPHCAPLAGMASEMVPRHVARERDRTAIPAVSVGVVPPMGFGRIAMGPHRPSNMVGGSIGSDTGGAILLITGYRGFPWHRPARGRGTPF